MFGTLLGCAVYAGYNIFPFYYYYLELENQMHAAIRSATEYTDTELRDKLTYQIRRMKIPADPKDLHIERADRFMRIALPYKEVFYISYGGKDYDLMTFNFVAKAEGNF